MWKWWAEARQGLAMDREGKQQEMTEDGGRQEIKMTNEERALSHSWFSLSPVVRVQGNRLTMLSLSHYHAILVSLEAPTVQEMLL